MGLGTLAGRECLFTVRRVRASGAQSSTGAAEIGEGLVDAVGQAGLLTPLSSNDIAAWGARGKVTTHALLVEDSGSDPDIRENDVVVVLDGDLIGSELVVLSPPSVMRLHGTKYRTWVCEIFTDRYSSV